MVTTLEEGDLYFLYRPRVRAAGKSEQTSPRSAKDVQRLLMVLRPRGRRLYRVVVLGRKHLPRIDSHERLWAFVDQVERNAKDLGETLEGGRYRTKTRGEREVPPVRGAGEGVYRLVRHDNHVHFAYALELPHRPGVVQNEFNIDDEGSFIISVKNPKKGSPRRTGLPREEKASLPKKLQEKFRDRRFADPDPPELLNYAGTELVLVGAREKPGVDLGAEHETEASAEIFRDLHLRKEAHRVKPLLEGKWA